MKWLVRGSIPVAAILVPAAFFLSVLSPDAKLPRKTMSRACLEAECLEVARKTIGHAKGANIDHAIASLVGGTRT